VKKRPDRSVLVFIHGFNNRFEDSVYRFAQIVHDSGTTSVPILVTWPSRGRLTAYGYDRESTNYTRNALEDLFQFLKRDPGIGEVSILAHSMGTWLALEGLRQMAIRDGGLPPKFSNVMLAAPDVASTYFARRSGTWAGSGRISRCSSHATTGRSRFPGVCGVTSRASARSIRNRSLTGPNWPTTISPSSTSPRSRAATSSITASSPVRRRSSGCSARACRTARP